jgi:pyridoxamine 5'-phosphate oxidase
VSLPFPWLTIERQIVVTGVADKLRASKALLYFLRRPRESQLSAWASPQSSEIPSRKFLEKTSERMKINFESGQVPLPSFWGGYLVTPRTIEFWQGGSNRLHDRFEYVRIDDGWRIQRLAP